MRFEEMKRRVFDQFKEMRKGADDQKLLEAVKDVPEDWEEHLLECVNVGQVIEFLEEIGGFDHHAGTTGAEFIIDCMIDNETMWYVATPSICVVIKAIAEKEAREIGASVIEDMVSKRNPFAPTYKVESLEDLVCREATPDEIKLHEGNVVR